MADETSLKDVSDASIGQQLEVRRDPAVDDDLTDGVNASPVPSGNLRLPQPQIWTTLPSGLFSAIQKIFKELLPQAAPTAKNIHSILKKRGLKSLLDRSKRSFYIYKEYLSPAHFINVEDVKPAICHLPEDQFAAIITLAKLANLTQLALTVIPSLNDGSLLSEETILDLDAAFATSFFTSSDLYRQQDDDKSHIVDSFARYIKEIRTYSFIKSLEAVRAEHGSDPKDVADRDENLFGTFYLGEPVDDEVWSSSQLKGWDFDEVSADGSGRYDHLPAEYRLEFETRVAELRSMYDKESIHWNDIKQQFPWENFVVSTVDWIKLIYKYLKDVDFQRESSLVPLDDVGKAARTPPASQIQQHFTPSQAADVARRETADRTGSPLKTPAGKEVGSVSDTSSDFLAAVAAKSVPAKSSRETVLDDRAHPASSPIRPSVGRSQPSLPPSVPSSESSSISDGGDIPPFNEPDLKPSQISPKVTRLSKASRAFHSSQEPPAGQTAQQHSSEKDAAQGGEKKTEAKVDSAWSKLLYFLRPTGQDRQAAQVSDDQPTAPESSRITRSEVRRSIPWSQGEASDDEQPAFAEIGRKIRAATTDGVRPPTQQNEKSQCKRSFNDPQTDAQRVSPIDSQRLITSSASQRGASKRTRDEVSYDSEEEISTLQSQKRARLSSGTHRASVNGTEEGDASQISQPPRRGRPRKFADKRVPSRPVVKSSVRKAWTDEECEALIEGVALFGSSWSKIKARDNNLNNPKLTDRSQMNLKDKARQIALDYYRARKPLPAGFELVPLQSAKVMELEDLGILVVKDSWGHRRTANK